MHRNDKLHGSWFKEVYSCIVMINSIAPDCQHRGCLDKTSKPVVHVLPCLEGVWWEGAGWKGCSFVTQLGCLPKGVRKARTIDNLPGKDVT